MGLILSKLFNNPYGIDGGLSSGYLFSYPRYLCNPTYSYPELGDTGPGDYPLTAGEGIGISMVKTDLVLPNGEKITKVGIYTSSGSGNITFGMATASGSNYTSNSAYNMGTFSVSGSGYHEFTVSGGGKYVPSSGTYYLFIHYGSGISWGNGAIWTESGTVYALTDTVWGTVSMSAYPGNLQAACKYEVLSGYEDLVLVGSSEAIPIVPAQTSGSVYVKNLDASTKLYISTESTPNWTELTGLSLVLSNALGTGIHRYDSNEISITGSQDKSFRWKIETDGGNDTEVYGVTIEASEMEKRPLVIYAGDITELLSTDKLIGAPAVSRNLMGGQLVRDSDTQLSWSPFLSAENALFSNSDGDWQSVVLASAPTLPNTATDMGGTSLTYNKNYDIFLKYTNGTSATLCAAPWAADTARYAAWVTSHGYKVGDRVSESGSYYACVTTHTSGTFSSDLSSGYWIEITGTGDNLGLGILDGVPVYAASGAWREYRYVGVIRLRSDTGAKFTDSISQRWISNRYNFNALSFGMPNPYSSTTSELGNSSGWYSWDGNGDTWKISCVLERSRQVSLTAHALASGASGSNPAQIGIGIDSKALAANASSAHVKAAATSVGAVSIYDDQVDMGYHYFYAMQRSQTTPPTFYYWYEDSYLQTHAQFNGSIG